MLVKCKCHGEKKEKDLLYKIENNGKNDYYCSEDEYTKRIYARETKNKIYLIINDIFGHKVTNTALFKEIAEIASAHTYEKILSYLQYKREDLDRFMSKSFSSEYGKIRYMSAILKNNLADYEIPKVEIIKQTEPDMTEVKYIPKTRKKSLGEFMDEME